MEHGDKAQAGASFFPCITMMAVFSANLGCSAWLAASAISAAHPTRQSRDQRRIAQDDGRNYPPVHTRKLA
jgi:hypothetical protein